MKIMFWNIRGLGKSARRRHIRDYIIEEELDGIGLQKIMRADLLKKTCLKL
jgi:hypothetical protein